MPVTISSPACRPARKIAVYDEIPARIANAAVVQAVGDVDYRHFGYLDRYALIAASEDIGAVVVRDTAARYGKCTRYKSPLASNQITVPKPVTGSGCCGR
jgi:hypothetical protein